MTWILVLLLLVAALWLGHALGYARGYRAGTDQAAARIAGFVRSKTMD